MSKWISDESGNLINVAQIEKLGVESNEKFQENTDMVYNAVAHMINGNKNFLGKIVIRYTEIDYEGYIIEKTFRELITSEQDCIGFDLIADVIKEQSKNKVWLSELMDEFMII